MNKAYYDMRCLDRNVAIRAIYLLWQRRAWDELKELGLDRSIDGAFEGASLLLPGSRPRSNAHTETFLAALPLSIADQVILASHVLVTAYISRYGRYIEGDRYLKGGEHDRRASSSE